MDSHEIVRRHFLHFKRMELPEDIEIIILDDGSDPPLEYPPYELPNLIIHPTNDKRPWTVSLARNLGAELAKSDYLLKTDIDHILVRGTIKRAYEFKEDRMTFKREFGVLDENGFFTQDVNTLLGWGLLPESIKKKGLSAPPHGNSFVMRKELFKMTGGYRIGYGREVPSNG